MGSPGTSRALRMLCGLGFGLGVGCSAPPPDTGSVRFLVRTTPAPDDVVLSPLRDVRVTALELRDARTDDLLSRGRFEPTTPASLNLGFVPVSETRDVRLLALGAAGQQLLGMALARDVSWRFGETQQVTLEMRRPLFFFGGGDKLVPLKVPPDPVFAPTRQLFTRLREETKLRVIDPNSVEPLLSMYDRQFDTYNPSPGVTTAPPTSATAGTYDGQSLLLGNTLGKFHVVDTLRLEDQASFELPEFVSHPPQAIVVDPLDRTAVVLQYAKGSKTEGKIGILSFVRNLPGLRSRLSRDGELLAVSIETKAASPIGQPLSAAYSLDGSVDVVFGKPPAQTGEPDCQTLGNGDVSVLRRYNPQTGEQLESRSLPYTVGVAYTAGGDQVLLQPCTTVPGANRPGRVVIAKSSGQKVLSAPGVVAMSTIGSALVGVGRDDGVDSPTLAAKARIYVLEAGAEKWSASDFDLAAWQIPYRITVSADGKPYVSSVDIAMSPTDAMGYALAVTPDRARALSLVRVQHKVRGLFISLLGSSNQYRCFMDFSGYSYHVVLLNLQSGAREQDYIVGVQNQDCASRVYDSNNNYVGTCLPACDPLDPQPYLLGFAQGYAPVAASVLFGR